MTECSSTTAMRKVLRNPRLLGMDQNAIGGSRGQRVAGGTMGHNVVGGSMGQNITDGSKDQGFPFLFLRFFKKPLEIKASSVDVRSHFPLRPPTHLPISPSSEDIVTFTLLLVKDRAFSSSNGMFGCVPLELCSGLGEALRTVLDGVQVLYGGHSVAYDAAPIFSGSEVLLLFGKEGQCGSSIGGKEERIWWVYFAGDQVLWLADVVEEAIEAQRKDGFARSFREEVRVLKVRIGSNKAGCFLGVAVFAEGDPKGINKLPKGHGGWGWQRFMDELRSLLAQLVAKEMPEVSVINARVGGSAPSFANVLTAPLGDLKSYIVEALISMGVRFDLGSHLSRGGSIESMVALRRLAMEFMGKFRAEVDRFICFGLGFRVKASRDIRKRMGWVFSRLGLKPKLHFGCKLRGRSKPNPLVEGSRVKAGSGQGEASTEPSWRHRRQTGHRRPFLLRIWRRWRSLRVHRR
jgi:hypothetical protein